MSTANDALIQLNITSSTKSLPIVRSAVERLAKIEGFSDEEAHGLTWAIDEALSNVIKHGYGGKSDQPIDVSLGSASGPKGQRGIKVVVRDQGKQVDPKTIVSRNLAEVRPGGLGVHIIQTVMDEYDYSCPPDGGMKLTMVKYHNAEPTTCGK